jgi:hypothetical protein
MSLVSEYLIALFFTIAVEIIVAVVFGYRNKLAILSVVLVNLITNPLANYIVLFNTYTHFLPENILVGVLEISIVFAEWGLLVYTLKKEPRKLLLLSISMNMASYLLGLLLF